jgi:BASS family bile acid:Na+ symporter
MSHIWLLAGSAATVAMILFLVTVMFSIGLEVTFSESLAAMGNKRLLIRALTANFILVPLLGLGISRILSIPPATETALLLLAAAPGAVFAINFTRTMQGGVSTAAGLMFLLTVLSIVFTPDLARLLLGIDKPLTIHYETHIRGLILYVILPLLAGFVVNRRFRALAEALRKPAKISANICFAGTTVLMLSARSAATKQIGMAGILAMLLLITGSMLIGWVMGGPDLSTQRVMTVNTGMRNVAICLALAVRSFPGTDVVVPLVAFSALMLPPSLVFTLYQRRKIKKQADLAAQSLEAAKHAA